MKVAGKVALVTGGSSGIGLETARLLAQKGAGVWLVARGRDRLDSSLKLIEAVRCNPAQRFGAVVADVVDPSQADATVARVTAACGPPDILVNSAGAVHPGLFSETGAEVARDLMDVNYFGAVNVIRACLPAMIAGRSGHIVNISSVYGFLGGYAYASYCASKYALRGFSDSLRAELKPLGIAVSVVFPQNTATPQLEYEAKLKPDIIKDLDNTRIMSAEAVARAIVDGIERKRYIIIPGIEGRLLFTLSALTAVTDRVIERMVARGLKKASERRKTA